MPLLGEAELMAFPELPVEKVVPAFVARYQDTLALSRERPAVVIGANGLIRDRPGFTVELLARGSLDGAYTTERDEVLMVQRGHWRVTWNGGTAMLSPGDTCAVPPGLERTLEPAMTGEGLLFRVRPTDDPPGPARFLA